MSEIPLPDALRVAGQGWGQHRNDIEQRSPFGSQGFEGSGPLWVTSLVAPTLKMVHSGVWQALLLKLRGRANQLSMHCLMRPVPLGTMRGTMTLDVQAVQGATSMAVIAATQANKTLVQGDYLGMGTGATQQVVMIVDDATANGSGVITVNFEPPLRNTHAAAAAVTWNKPKALFRRATTRSQWHFQRQRVSGFSLDLIENPRP